MAIIYSPDHVPLQHAELGELEYQAIGRIVRACADIEDLITLFIAALGHISEAVTNILLGQTAISKKMAIASYLASARGPDLLSLTEKVARKRSKP